METTIKYLTNEETTELFRTIFMDNSLHSVRNYAIFMIAKYCALRVSEIGMLKIQDFNPALSQIYCRREKGSCCNTIRIIEREVQMALIQYLSIRKTIFLDIDNLFVSQQGHPISRKTLDVLIKNYCANTSISEDKRHFHVLKHTRAIELGNAGLDLKDIQWWLGHKSIENTQIYMQFTTFQQDILYQKLQGGYYGHQKN